MSSRFTKGGSARTIALVAISVFAVVLAYTLPKVHAGGQQAPAPSQGTQGAAPARGARAGGGFTRPTPVAWSDNTGFKAIFNGKDLSGWKGDMSVWHVEDGAITAETTTEKPTGTTNIWYTGAEPANFILKEEARMVGNGNGGIQFRSVNKAPAPRPAGAGGARGGRSTAGMTPAQIKQMQERQAQMQALREKNRPWSLMGYQEDMDTAGRFSGQLYEQGTGRGIIAYPGDVVLTEKGQKPALIGSVATADQIKAWIPNLQGWNRYEIIAQGHTLTQMVNGHVISILVDDDPTYFATKGVIGMEIEGQNVKISYRDIQLKVLP